MKKHIIVGIAIFLLSLWLGMALILVMESGPLCFAASVTTLVGMALGVAIVIGDVEIKDGWLSRHH